MISKIVQVQRIWCRRRNRATWNNMWKINVIISLRNKHLVMDFCVSVEASLLWTAICCKHPNFTIDKNFSMTNFTLNVRFEFFACIQINMQQIKMEHQCEWQCMRYRSRNSQFLYQVYYKYQVKAAEWDNGSTCDANRSTQSLLRTINHTKDASNLW